MDGDAIFKKIMKDVYGGKRLQKAIKEHCDALRGTGIKEDKFAANVYQILLESDVQWLDAQIFVAMQIIRDPQVEMWGRENYKDWKILDNESKIERLFDHLAASGALADARDYMNTAPGVNMITPMFYDVDDVGSDVSGRDPRSWEEFKKSKVFDDLKVIFKKYV